ncbi:MAG: prenyltransferase, partial [Leptolyngbya sp. DLM2.Bin15]
MTQTDINWDADLPIDPEEECQALIRALRRTQGFGLFFVSCSKSTGQEIIERTTRDLPGLTIQVLTLETALADGNLYQAIADDLS